MAAQQLAALCGALNVGHELPRYQAVQRSLFEPWGSSPIPEQAPYATQLGDDHSPYEYSLAFGDGSVELRILLETQAAEPGLVSNHLAALAFNEQLAQDFGLDLSRFNSLRDLFLPVDPEPPFTLWHAVCLNAGRAPAFKVYLNPAVRGANNAVGIGIEALGRLGFVNPERLFRQLARRGDDQDEFRYFSLDLTGGSTARVKLYFAHHGVTAREMEDALAAAPLNRHGDVTSFLDIVAERRGPFTEKPVTSCFSFVGSTGIPTAATCHFPIAHYSEDDQQSARRIVKYLATHDMDHAMYERALAAIAHEPLDGRIGFQSYASFRRERSGVRMTAYLSPELFRRGASDRSHSRIRRC